MFIHGNIQWWNIVWITDIFNKIIMLSERSKTEWFLFGFEGQNGSMMTEVRMGPLGRSVWTGKWHEEPCGWWKHSYLNLNECLRSWSHMLTVCASYFSLGKILNKRKTGKKIPSCWTFSSSALCVWIKLGIWTNSNNFAFFPYSFPPLPLSFTLSHISPLS